MLSQTAEYALRATLFLARAPDGSLLTSDSIAEALGAPRNYMSKTLYALARAGIVAGVRGPAGGFRLMVKPDVLTVAQVVEVFDSPRENPVCLLGGRPCSSRTPCQAHHEWTRVTTAMRHPMRTTTLATLLQS